jgi:hypothetical protein
VLLFCQSGIQDYGALTKVASLINGDLFQGVAKNRPGESCDEAKGLSFGGIG